MIGRPLSFIAGAGLGAYAVIKSRRAAEALTAEGLSDRLRAAKLGASLFADEVRAGAHEKQTQLRERHGLALSGPEPALSAETKMLHPQHSPRDEEHHDGQR